MTELRIYASKVAGMETDHDSAVFEAREPFICTSNSSRISAELKKRGIQFQHLASKPEIKKGASNSQVLKAYESLIASVQKDEKYQTVDVMRVCRDDPNNESLRQTFLQEHQHQEDEVRFFVEGCGLFSLHIDDEEIQVSCQAHDWIMIPAGTRHWFDMGTNPSYCVIRFFNNSEGWLATAPPDPIADDHPGLD